MYVQWQNSDTVQTNKRPDLHSPHSHSFHVQRMLSLQHDEARVDVSDFHDSGDHVPAQRKLLCILKDCLPCGCAGISTDRHDSLAEFTV